MLKSFEQEYPFHHSKLDPRHFYPHLHPKVLSIVTRFTALWSNLKRYHYRYGRAAQLGFSGSRCCAAVYPMVIERMNDGSHIKLLDG